MFAKKYIPYFVIIFLVGFALVFYLSSNKGGDVADIPSESPLVFISPTPSGSPTIIPRPSVSYGPTYKPTPLPTRELSEQTKRWNELSGPAYCELKGEIKYVNANTYDNQDALFVYNGIDHPGRLVNWTVSPQDDLKIGPNLFAQMPIPDGESLIGVSLPENPKYKNYELTAAVTYGRLVDGNIKVFTQDCVGKTTVVLP